MRLNLEQGTNDCQLVYDTYNNNWTCLKNVLQFTTQQCFIHTTTLILPDLDQVGISPHNLYSEVAQLIHSHKIDRLIGIGPRIKAYADQFKLSSTHFYDDIQGLLNDQLLNRLTKNLVIIKGSSIINSDTLLNKLRKRCHETVLEINLDAVEHNLNFFRSKLNKNTQVIAMLKASAYGSSSFEVAHFLQQCRVNYLSVAYVDEGVTLREDGIQLPIMVMNPSPSSFEKILDYQLEPVIYSLKLLEDWKNFIDEKGVPSIMHLKLDTGMHRLGFMEEDIDELIHILQVMPTVTIKTIFSHLAAPGARRHNHYTRAQAKLFQRLVHKIEAKLNTPPILKHLLNTAGAQYFPEYQFDMVRLGIGLYGFSKKVQKHLQIASSLKTIISQIKEVPAGATIGYDRKGVAQRPSKIATLPIGYADGFSRALSNGKGKVWINGKLAPVIGNVCMDMTMVDVTDIEAQEGDSVIIFGKELPIHEMTSALNTIVYEILTNVDERIKRICYKELPDCKANR